MARLGTSDKSQVEPAIQGDQHPAILYRKGEQVCVRDLPG